LNFCERDRAFFATFVYLKIEFIVMRKKDIPVLLLTGYLGSGKTTLLNHILGNEKGIKFAVIVNDIGEVNIDASLIQKGGVVGGKDNGDLVALQNGCICCTLKMDLVQQLADIAETGKFDYIVVEASGICEPEPIARTICSIPNMGEEYTRGGVPRLDCIATVVDALRMKTEFECGDSLKRKNLDEDDIENLVIQQIEFCNLILLNKISEVTREEADRVRAIIRAIQPKARIIECDYADVPIYELIHTNLFDFERTVTSATWVRELEGIHDDDDDDDGDEHDHHHHHHHHDHDHEEGEAEEYGIGTFVYYRRKPLDINKFDYFIHSQWPKSVIRAKGVIYFKHNTDMSYLFEQAGVQKSLTEAGMWYATAPKEELEAMAEQDPSILADWDPVYGDRMIKLVFIGRKMDRKAIEKALDAALG